MTTSSVDGPFISVALFCERTDEDERGVKSFINAIDTLNFDLSEPDAEMTWRGMLEVEIVFGEYQGDIEFEVFQLHADSAERVLANTQTFSTEQFPGMQAISISLNFGARYHATGLYWYEFALNGKKLTQVPLTVRAVQ